MYKLATMGNLSGIQLIIKKMRKTMRNVRERRFTDFFSQYYMQHAIRPSHTIFNLDLNKTYINTLSVCVILLGSYFVLFACFGFVCFKERENIKLDR